jgi:hypothetical protein
MEMEVGLLTTCTTQPGAVLVSNWLAVGQTLQVGVLHALWFCMRLASSWSKQHVRCLC